MATVVRAPKRKTVSYGSGGKKSSSSSGRVAANSYGDGTKYAGGNTFTKADGSSYQVTGEHTSPSGKVTYLNSDGSGTVAASKDKSQVGQTFYADGTSTMDRAPEVAEPVTSKYSYTYKGEYDDVGNDAYSLQVDALQTAMRDNKNALQAAYDESERTLNRSIADAQRQAYVNQQRSMRAMPQMMAAAGYSGGVTESTAANIMNEYQNALIDLDRSKAQELARLQTNLANGIAETDTQYQIQLANALQAAEQFEAQQAARREQMALQQRAAALEEQRYQDNLALQQAELQLAREKANAGTNTAAYTPNQVTSMVNSGLINADTGRELLGFGASAAPAPYSADTDRFISGWYNNLTPNEFEDVMARYVGNGRISADELQKWLYANGR